MSNVYYFDFFKLTVKKVKKPFKISLNTLEMAKEGYRGYYENKKLANIAYKSFLKISIESNENYIKELKKQIKYEKNLLRTK